MANILLTINNESRQVSKARSFAGVQLENLEDAFIVKFSNTFLDGDGILEYEVDGHSYFIPMTKDLANQLYSIDITKTLITEEGTYPFQVRIQRDEKIFKSQIFYLKIYPSINAIDTPPDMPNWQQWVIEYVAEYGGKIDTISVNGTQLPISEDKNVNILVPTKTSDLQNDGDGNNSPYATEQYVDENGGKIDKIQKNGVELPINNKTVNVPVPVKTSELVNDGNGESPFPTKAEVNTALGQVGEAIQDINSKIPLQASSQNQLADKNFVNSSIATNTANYLGDYNIVTDLGLTTSATHQQVAAALATKMQSLSIVPTNNDYCYVKYPDATVPTQFIQFDRYKYNGDNSVWLYEFTLNNSSFTAEQWAAINSGITGTILQQILDAVSALQQAMTTKQNTLTAGDNITIQNDTISADVPLKSVSLGGTNIPISNENADIPIAEAQVMDIEEAEEVDVVTSIGATPSDDNIPTEKAVADAIDDAASTKTDLSDIAPNYDNTSTYAVGDCVNYDGDIWKCNTAISTAEEWDSSHWTRKTVKELIDENQPDLSNCVTLTGAQTISGQKIFSSHIYVNKGGRIGDGANSYIEFDYNQGTSIYGLPIWMRNDVAPSTNNKRDLGSSYYKWKDFYLAGNLSDGSKSISIANIANKNDIDLIYEKTVNKVTSISNSSTDTQYPSAKAVYDYGEAIRTVAEGKCKSYTISDITNASFNSQSASLSGITSFVDIAGNTIQTSSLKNGDIVLVIETDVPDRWYSSSDSKFYILETAKVDLSNYATQSDLTTGLAGKQAALTTAQQDAVDSGIDSTKVAQIATNTNDIANCVVKETGVSTYAKVYVKTPQGVQARYELRPDAVNAEDVVVGRTYNGNLAVPLTPDFNNHAASKKYVDDNIPHLYRHIVTFNAYGGSQFSIELLLPTATALTMSNFISTLANAGFNAKSKSAVCKYYYNSYYDMPQVYASGSSLYGAGFANIGEFNFVFNSSNVSNFGDTVITIL